MIPAGFILFGAAGIVGGIQSTAMLGGRGGERHRAGSAVRRLDPPQMIANVTYGYSGADVIIAIELVLVFLTIRVLVAAPVVHLTNVVLCVRSPQLLNLWLACGGRCSRIRNRKLRA